MPKINYCFVKNKLSNFLMLSGLTGKWFLANWNLKKNNKVMANTDQNQTNHDFWTELINNTIKTSQFPHHLDLQGRHILVPNLGLRCECFHLESRPGMLKELLNRMEPRAKPLEFSLSQRENLDPLSRLKEKSKTEDYLRDAPETTGVSNWTCQKTRSRSMEIHVYKNILNIKNVGTSPPVLNPIITNAHDPGSYIP